MSTASVNTALGGGRLLAAISTSIVAILRESYGRGPMKAKTYAVDDMIFVAMRASGYTPLEQTLIDHDGDGGDRVVAMRHEFQLLVADRYKQAIEGLTGRNVVAFLSQAHIDPDVTIEVFFIDGPLPGFDVAESVERDTARQAVAVALAGGGHCMSAPNARSPAEPTPNAQVLPPGSNPSRLLARLAATARG